MQIEVRRGGGLNEGTRPRAVEILINFNKIFTGGSTPGCGGWKGELGVRGGEVRTVEFFEGRRFDEGEVRVDRRPA